MFEVTKVLKEDYIKYLSKLDEQKKNLSSFTISFD